MDEICVRRGSSSHGDSPARKEERCCLDVTSVSVCMAAWESLPEKRLQGTAKRILRAPAGVAGYRCSVQTGTLNVKLSDTRGTLGC